jgi:hypothetical protein
MSLIATVLAFATGLAARVKPPKPDAESERDALRVELDRVRAEVDLLRLALMEAQRPLGPVVFSPPLREIVDCTGGGRYAHLRGQQQHTALQQQHALQQYAALQQQHAQQMLGMQTPNALANAQMAMQAQMQNGPGFYGQGLPEMLGGLLGPVDD